MTKQISGEEHAAMTSTATKKTSNNFPSKLIGLCAGIFLLLAVGFFGGVQYQKNQTSNKSTASNNQSNNNPNAQDGVDGFGGGRMGMRGGIGEVSAINDSSISVKNSFNDSTTTYEITDNTQITENGENVEKGSIQVGDRVIVQASSSNSKQASRILVNPQMPNRPSSTQGQSFDNSDNFQTN